jgi:hypothetical protein
MRFATLVVLSLGLAALACASPPDSYSPPQDSVFDDAGTAFGFFPSPPEASTSSVLKHFRDLGQHADFILVQPNIPWEDFTTGGTAESPRLTDIRNQVLLAQQNGLEAAFVIDPLNGLNRREFFGLPADWNPSFATTEVRQGFADFALWIAREFQPAYLGLASEINTYADAHPDDFPNYLSLYREVYASVKAESPTTRVFVTFQWEDLNNILAGAAEGRTAYHINWDQVEAFEPDLDLWVISSYPFVAFPSGAQIPADYYTPLLTRTSKPLAVAEGGYTSEPMGPFPGTPQDQVDYLTSIHDQIGGRLRFWVYLLLSDFNQDSYNQAMAESGRSQEDANTLGMFSAVGLRAESGEAKPALELWDRFRAEP